MKISIITICYNSEKTIKETIESVLDQRFPNIEYVIKDGGSKDSTLNIINQMSKDNCVVCSRQDTGISDAFNQGIRMSTGDCIGIINSDDILLPDASELVEKAFRENPDVDVVYGNCICFKNELNDGYIFKPNTNLELLKSRFYLMHPAIFVKKSAYEKYGLFDCNYRNSMDFELVSRFYFAGAKFKYIDEVLSAFRAGGVSDSSFKRTMIETKRIGIRNGSTVLDMNLFVCRQYIRRAVLKILNMLKIENQLRYLLKNQKKWSNNKNGKDKKLC